MVGLFLACGVDVEKCSIFVQSQIPMHCELMWQLACIVPQHWLNRMTQYKSKKGVGSSVALYTYPILMASDILLYNPKFVPVGDDQNQHLELTRNIANRINKIAEEEILNVPKTINFECKRIKGLQSDKKMSKSDTSFYDKVNLSDSKEEIDKKIKKALTDNRKIVTRDKLRVNLQNLLTIYSGFSN